MMKKISLLASALSLLCTFSVLALCLPMHAADSMVSASDATFAQKAAMGGMMEVVMGEIAQKNAQSQEVKDFAAMMVTDHSKANAELKNIAEKKGIKLLEVLSKKHQIMVDGMSKLTGAQFDRAYANAIKSAATTVSDPELKQFVTETLPIIEGHLSKIEEIQTSMNKSLINQSSKKNGSS